MRWRASYEDRADVRGAFPDIGGADRAAFMGWAAGDGVNEELVLAKLVAGGSIEATPDDLTAAAAKPSLPLRGAPWGVNVIGEFQSQDSDGAVARAIVSALDAGGIRALPVRTRMRAEEPGPITRPRRPSEAPFTVNLLCLEPGLDAAFRS